VATISINSPMGGITEPFLDQYVWTDAYGTDWVLNYTPNMAGGSGPGTGLEGWTVGGDAWQPGEPEIFCFYGDWYSYDPDQAAWPTFHSFLNGTEGTGGLRYDTTTQQDFLPLETGEHLDQALIVAVGGSDVAFYLGVTVRAEAGGDDRQYHNSQTTGQALLLSVAGSDALLVVLDDFEDGNIAEYDDPSPHPQDRHHDAAGQALRVVGAGQ